MGRSALLATRSARCCSRPLPADQRSKRRATEALGSMKIISWNIARRAACWKHLLSLDADIALLQEAAEPPPEIAERIDVDPAPWRLAGRDCHVPRAWRSAVVKLADRVQVEWIESQSIDAAGTGELAVSRLGTLAAAHVTPPGSEPIVCVSMYSPWTTPHASTESSDIAAGDLNVLYGHGEHGSAYWAGRYETVFTRMKALGLPFVGPQAPNGRQADPWPDELPRDSRNVPTYHTNRQTPATATRQLDFVFASCRLPDRASTQYAGRMGSQRPLLRGDRDRVVEMATRKGTAVAT